MSPAAVDKVWRGTDTNPGEIEHALSGLLKEIHQENPQYVPARVINLVCVVDKEWSGEIANRLRGVGRNHGSRTIVLSINTGRKTLDATATVTAPRRSKTASSGCCARRSSSSAGSSTSSASTRSSIRWSSPIWRPVCGRRTAIPKRSMHS